MENQIYIMLATSNPEIIPTISTLVRERGLGFALAKAGDEAKFFVQHRMADLAIIETDLRTTTYSSETVNNYGPDLVKELKETWNYKGPIIGLYSGELTEAEKLWEDNATVLVSNDQIRENLGNHIDLLLTSPSPLLGGDETTARL